MGVRLNLDNALDGPSEKNNNVLIERVAENGLVMGGGFLDYIELEESMHQRQPKQDPHEISHTQEELLFKKREDTEEEKSDHQGEKESKEDELLPPGWERHQDDDGPYYWHISSGTIQREPPPSNQIKRISRELDAMCNLSSSSSDSSSDGLDRQPMRRSYPVGGERNPVRFAVRSLGWVEIAEEDLTPERSSRAVNKCIVDLSMGRNDIMDAVGRWGDGKDLYMDLDDCCLQLIDPQDSTLLNTQAIHSIRVWGVGRDNGRERDFAYVARDRSSRRHMCHVFRCDMPARVIANTLRDVCKRIVSERSVRPKSVGSHLNLCSSEDIFFPLPMEEPRKVLKVHYLGCTLVGKPTGVETVNIAIDRLTLGIPPEEYKPVDVAVAPSTITVSCEQKILAECRVRFLSFLGIGRDVKTCAFIVHTAQEQYVAHVFHCMPSTGALCKTVEAACKLRYQKCLDAHRLAQRRQRDTQQQNKIGATIRNALGTITTRLTKTSLADA